MTYEFTNEENQDFEILTKRLLAVTIGMALMGLTGLFSLIYDFNWYILLFSLTLIVFGVFFYLPIDNFKRIITTEGSDIKELIRGFYELRTGWNISVAILAFLVIVSFFTMVGNLLF